MDRLKKELQKLRRENSRLKKQLNRLDNDEFEDLFKDDEEPPKESSDKKNIKKQSKEPAQSRPGDCANCEKQTRTVEFGQYKYLWCDHCNHRQKIK